MDGKTVTGPDLLKRAIFYKVGHHGSHNATLSEKGLEQMERLRVAMIPVDHDDGGQEALGKDAARRNRRGADERNRARAWSCASTSRSRRRRKTWSRTQLFFEVTF